MLGTWIFDWIFQKFDFSTLDLQEALNIIYRVFFIICIIYHIMFNFLYTWLYLTKVFQYPCICLSDEFWIISNALSWNLLCRNIFIFLLFFFLLARFLLFQWFWRSLLFDLLLIENFPCILDSSLNLRIPLNHRLILKLLNSLYAIVKPDLDLSNLLSYLCMLLPLDPHLLRGTFLTLQTAQLLIEFIKFLSRHLQ